MPQSTLVSMLLAGVLLVTQSLVAVKGDACHGNPNHATCQDADPGFPPRVTNPQESCEFTKGCNYGYNCQDSSGALYPCCTGNVVPCSSYGSNSDCATQGGCWWGTPGSNTVTPADGVDGCFSPDTTVQVMDSGSAIPTTKKMKELQVGDSVLTNAQSNTFEPVYAFGHFDPVTRMDFLKLSFGEGESDAIELTPDHMIYLHGKSSPVRADNVVVGDRLVSQKSSIDGLLAATVVSMSRVQKQGLYAPLTASGTIVVNGALASSYVALHKKSDTAEIKVHGFTVPFIDQNSFCHLAVSPLRMACSLTGSSLALCLGEHDTLDGLNPYVAWGMEMVQWGEQQQAVVQFLLILAAVCTFLAFTFVESVLCGNVGGISQSVVILASYAALGKLRGAASKKSKVV